MEHRPESAAPSHVSPTWGMAAPWLPCGPIATVAHLAAVARISRLDPAEHGFELAAARGRGAAVSLQIPPAFEEPMYVGA
jgi:hypothetical protein